MCRELKLSKSYLSSLVKILTAHNLLMREPRSHNNDSSALPAMGRPRETLAVNPDCCCTVVLYYGASECVLSVLRFGKSIPLLTRRLKPCRRPDEFVSLVTAQLKEMLSELKIPRSSVKILTVAAQAVLEQGPEGRILQDEAFDETDFALGTLLMQSLSLPVYVCSRAWLHLRGLLEKHKLRQSMVLMCGEGTVNLGIIINSQIIMGPRNTLPQCSHLKFPYSLKECLGRFGPHTEEALEFAVSALSPIFSINEEVISGPALEGHHEIISKVQNRLCAGKDPLMQDVRLVYLPLSAEERFLQLCYLSFDQACILLAPKIIKSAKTNFAN